MTARVAAVLAAGVSSLFATAALAGPGYGAYPPPPGPGFAPPPGYDQPQFSEPDYTPPPPPGYAPLPAEAYAPPPQDDRPWPPAYAPSRYGPSFYRGGAAAEGHEGCGPCGAHHHAPPAPPPPPPPHYHGSCSVRCGEATELQGEAAPAISDAFFYGGMSGGAGPGLEIGGPAGGGAFGYASAFGGASSYSYAYAYATASAHAKSHGGRHPSKPGCGCGGKGK